MEGGESRPAHLGPASGPEELQEGLLERQGAIEPTAAVPPQSAQALSPEHQQIVDALYDTWSNDQERRKESERILSECEKGEQFILYLLDICCLREVHNNVRKLAIIYAKNLVSRFWSCKDLFHFSSDVKRMVKEKILAILANRSTVSDYYKELSTLLRKVARYELVHNYPQLLQFFLQELSARGEGANPDGHSPSDCRSPADDLSSLYTLMYLLHKVLREQYSKKLLKDKKETFHISQKFIDCLYPFWENHLNVHFQRNLSEACMCGSEATCNKCYGEYSAVMELEGKLAFDWKRTLSPKMALSPKRTSPPGVRCAEWVPAEGVPVEGGRTSSSVDGGESSDVHGSGRGDAYCCRFNAESDKKVKILKFVDSILLNLIISRDDVQRERGRTRGGGQSPQEGGPSQEGGPYQEDGRFPDGHSPQDNRPPDGRSPPDCGPTLRKKPFLDCLANKTVFYLKFVRKDSPVYHQKYLKFLLNSFLHIIEFQSDLHEYVKKDTTEQFICLFLKKHLHLHLRKDLHLSNDYYDSTFVDIINICINILRSLFYHFCLSQYNLIKQKKVRENYLTVKNMISSSSSFFEGCPEKTDLQTKIINTLVVNINNLESESKKGKANKNYSFRDILTYIREEVRYALTSDEYILMHNQKALEIFEFLRTHCINMSAEQIMDVMLNVKDKDGYEVEENIFYSSARECIIEIASEPFLFSIFSHFFEPLINSLHNYAHMIKSVPDKLKDLQVPDFSEAIIELDGYLNIYCLLYSSLHKKIKAEHILCMINFFTDYLSIELTHPLVSYRIASILKVWLKNYKASFPFIDEVAVLIFENIRLLCMHLSPKCVVGSLLRAPGVSGVSGVSSVSGAPPENHYAAQSANFLPLVFFKFVCLFSYIFKYEYVYENHDSINEILVGPLISLLTQIAYPKSIQKVLQILSHIVFLSNKEKDITIFKDNYHFLLDLYRTSNLSIKEYMLNILVQILNKNYEVGCGLVEFAPHAGAVDSPSMSTRGDDSHGQGRFQQGGFSQGGFPQSGLSQGGFPQGGLSQGGDDCVLFHFSFDVIAYTILGRRAAEQVSPPGEGGQHPQERQPPFDGLDQLERRNLRGDHCQRPPRLANSEVNLHVDQTISDSFYTLWLCNLKIISKLFPAKNEEIVKRVCSLYVRTTHVISEHFKRKVSSETTREMSCSCLDVLMEYMCLFILHEKPNFYLTYEAVSTSVLTNELLRPQLLAIVRNNFTLGDEGNTERCIYLLHVCMGLYKNRLKEDMPVLYHHVASFVVIYLLKVVLKYMGKFFPVCTCFEGSPKGGSERGSEKENSGHLHGDNPAELLPPAEGHFPKAEKEEASQQKFMTHSERQTKYIHENVVSYQREESFDAHFGLLQNDLKQLLGMEYLQDYNLGAVFKNYNFNTVNEDSFSYINKHTVLTLIAILSLYESNLLHYILICFLVYFRINVPLLLSSIFYQAQYIHNKGVMMALLLFIYILTENYLFRDFVPSLVRSHLLTSCSSSSPYLEELLYDRNKCSDFFACTGEDYTFLIIQLLKLINTMLNTSRDIYIEMKNILHLNTASSNLSATKMYHSAGYNSVMRGVLKHDDLPGVCNKALDNVLTFLRDVKDLDDRNATSAIVNYLRENVEGMNVALVDMYKKYLGYQ
ncbi:hypothetical protein, conserved [Plasmodium vivax]|uniref:Importin N-terminal domain-containing protein n=2 Tax=Plasmodium vivax TaxID=5855 RepID=A5K0S8_PLAVS|nr:hypothetical protein, conserved [Plasmodium vivax]EDL46925.1 hypothetical protein, conserved [Plasmodium vivax]KMZ90916.1 hypothetical protein PVMG_04105 [Plasmodium vivax Mauritania I]|eukprot:XP_001616652.1 hypothetical protein [Plasmodium vivax Sal-1]